MSTAFTAWFRPLKKVFIVLSVFVWAVLVRIGGCSPCAELAPGH